MCTFVQDFVNAAFDTPPTYRWEDRDCRSADVRRVLADLARTLVAHHAALSDAAALDAVAVGSGFSDWHTLTATAARIAARFGSGTAPELGDSAAFLDVRALLVTLEEGMPPSPKHAAALLALGHGIAVQTGCPAPTVMATLAGHYQASSWADLAARRPIDSPLPLYRFVRVGELGRIGASSACRTLMREVDRLFLGIAALPDDEQRQRVEQASTLVRRRPDLLEARVHIAIWEADRAATQSEQAGAFASFAALDRDIWRIVPVGFRGQLPFRDGANHWYYRWLHRWMCLAIDGGRYDLAARLARRQLRQCGADQLGVRLVLPMLLLALRQPTKAVAASRRLARERSPDTMLLRGLCMAAAGRTREGHALMLRATFDLPPLCIPVLAPRRLSVREQRLWNPVCERSPDVVAWLCRIGLRHNRALAADVRALYGRADVAATAATLQKQFAAACAAPGDRRQLFAAWRTACDDAARALGDAAGANTAESSGALPLPA